MKTDLLDLRCADCMDLMAEYPDNYFDLAVVDPPYGIRQDGHRENNRSKLAVSKKYHDALWDQGAPCFDYFRELFRVSKNQVVWGANHFISSIAVDASCWLVWDKENGNNDFADAELAWTSFKTSVRIFSFRRAGMLQGDMKNKEVRIHPTQKPVRLYAWIFENYLKEGGRVLDTHLGSGSSAVAAYYAGLEFVGCELDETYYAEMVVRVENETRQGLLSF